MKIISCPIPGKSLIVQFESAAAKGLQDSVGVSGSTQSQGLLLGSLSGTDPKWLHIQQTQPIFGIGDTPDTGVSEPVNGTEPLITLGYYTIRSNSASLTPVERDFLASSLPPSASVAMIVTPQPSRRMLAQFYLRDRQGAFASTPDHRQVMLAQDAPRPALVREPLPAFVPLVTPTPAPVSSANTSASEKEAPRRMNGLWLKLGVAAAIGGAVLWWTQPQASSPKANPALVAAPVPSKPPVAAVSVLPQPTFMLPVKSVKSIQDPPEVAIWYPVPGKTTVQPAEVADARHDVLVHPILSAENPR